MRVRLATAAVLISLFAAAPLLAQFGGPDDGADPFRPSDADEAPAGRDPFDRPEEVQPGGVRLGETFTYRYEVGVVVQAIGGPCGRMFATIPVPTDWPAQDVRIADEDFSTSVRGVNYRTIRGGVKQMLIHVPQLGGGATAKALVTFEVKVRTLLPPKDPSRFELMDRPDRAVLPYLGPSPYIDPRNGRIRSLAREITAEKESAWEQVEAIYQWVRENIERKKGKLKGSVEVLTDGGGNHEDITSLMIALCRAHRIPARTVWVPDHCYLEFYLEDEEGRGHWIPADPAGEEGAFGGTPFGRIILMKGDNFQVPESRRRMRFVREFLTGKPLPGGGRPKVEFVRNPSRVID